MKQWAKKLKAKTYVLYLARKDPRIPWYAKVLAILVVGYAFSPIDLIPDPIPILGYLDDLILVPLGIALVVRFIPNDVWAEYTKKAEARIGTEQPKSWLAGAIIVLIWLMTLAGVGVVFMKVL